MSTTIKDIITDLEAFATAHPQIKDFGWGNISNISTKDHDFCMMWLMPTQSQYNGSMTTITFEMYIMDILEQDRSNLLDIMNNMLIYGNDTIAYFWEDNNNLDFDLNEEDVIIQPFEGKFDDHTAGWVFTIDIQLKTNLNSCITPIA